MVLALTPHELIEFVRQEQRDSDTSLTVIAHGGTGCDFPIILANCMKSDIDYDFLRECEFIDSVEVFKSNGCPTPGFDTLCTTNNIKNTDRHTARSDAYSIKIY